MWHVLFKAVFLAPRTVPGTPWVQIMKHMNTKMVGIVQ